MKVAALLLAAMALSVTTLAMAATTTPKLSGVYNLSISTVCQAAVPVAPTTVDVPPNLPGPTTDSIIAIDKSETVNTGQMKQLFAAVTITPSKSVPGTGSIAINGTFWGGDLVFTGTEQQTTAGITSQSQVGSGTYTNSATQFAVTAGAHTDTYQALYSNISGGIAQRVDLVEVYASSGTGASDCIAHGTAVHQ